MLDSAKAIEPVKNSFDRLSKWIDQNSNDILASLKKASKWTISDYDLMLSANKAMSLWVAKNTDNSLMDSKSKGEVIDYAFSDIVTGLWRSSPMILDNLWITIKLWEAQEKYAKILWKTVEQMTDEEKKRALINAVVSEGKQELLEAWEVAMTTAERQAMLQASFQNLSATLWTALIPAFEKVMEIISPIIEKISLWITEKSKTCMKPFYCCNSNCMSNICTFNACTYDLNSFDAYVMTALIYCTCWIAFLLDWICLKVQLYQQTKKIAWYNTQIAELTAQYQAWTISQDEYKLKLAELQAQIDLATESSKTLWWTMRDDLDATLNMMLHPIESAKKAFKKLLNNSQRRLRFFW